MEEYKKIATTISVSTYTRERVNAKKKRISFGGLKETSDIVINRALDALEKLEKINTKNSIS